MDRLTLPRLTLLKKTAYASPGLALAVIGVPLYVYIPKFYSDVIGAPLSVIGYVVLAARILDGVLDPAIGYLSDNSRSRFGRRRPFIAISSIALAILIYLIYNPPASSGAFTATIWFSVCLMGLSIAWTLVNVPWEALGPELTFDYHERTGLFAFRDGVMLAGVLIAVASPALLKHILDLPDTSAGEREKFFWFAAMYSPLVIISCWWCVAVFRERPVERFAEKLSPWAGLKMAARNRPFIILLISYTVAGIGANLPATLILYYVEHVLLSKHADFFLVLYILTGIVFLPLWVAMSRRVGKKQAWLGAMAVNTGAFVGVFFLGPGDEWIYGVLTFLSGIGFGATVAIPSAMQADVIDYDEMMTGQRREGQYIGIWSIMKKLSSAAGMGLALAILGRSGYTPNMEQSETVVITLRILYALAPAGCLTASFFIALAYPIDEKQHQAILDRITHTDEKGVQNEVVKMIEK